MLVDRWLTVLQIVALVVVAITWWRGPQVPKLRLPISSLLLLNAAFVTFFTTTRWMDPTVEGTLLTLAQACDRSSDVALLWTVLRLSFPTGGLPAVERTLLGVATAALAFEIGLFAFFGVEGQHPAVTAAFVEFPLWLAIGATPVAWWRMRSKGSGAPDWPIAILTAALLIRFAGNAIVYAYSRHARAFDSANPWLLIGTWEALIAFWALTGGVLLIILFCLKTSDAGVRARWLTLLLAASIGGLIGFGLRSLLILDGVGFTFTIGILRPVFVLGAMAAMTNVAARGRAFRSGLILSGAAVGSGIGLYLASSAWQLAPEGTVAMGIAFGLLLAPLAFAVRDPLIQQSPAPPLFRRPEPDRAGEDALVPQRDGPTWAQILVGYLYEIHEAGGGMSPRRAICKATGISPKSLAGEVKRAEVFLARHFPHAAPPFIQVSAVGVRARKVYALTPAGATAAPALLRSQQSGGP